VIADLFEAGEKRQNNAPALDALNLRRFQPFRQIGHSLLIQSGLAAGQRTERRHFRLVGQVRDDAFVRFQPPQYVRPYQSA
jgi:hypothetical protein